MSGRWLWLPLIIAAGTASAADPPRPAALAARIDERVAAGWEEHKVKPAPPADDAEFCRRVFLDLTGYIPHVSEVRECLDDKAPDKRAKWIALLLNNPAYARHFTIVWRPRWLPRAGLPENAALVPGFEAWLRRELKENAPYDRMVQDLMITEVPPAAVGGQEPLPGAFWLGLERSPEGQAAATARLFLGLNL